MPSDPKTTVRAPVLDVCAECADAGGGVWPRGHVATFWNGNCDACRRERVCCAVGDYNWPKGLPRDWCDTGRD